METIKIGSKSRQDLLDVFEAGRAEKIEDLEAQVFQYEMMEKSFRRQVPNYANNAEYQKIIDKKISIEKSLNDERGTTFDQHCENVLLKQAFDSETKTEIRKINEQTSTTVGALDKRLRKKWKQPDKKAKSG